MFVPATYRETKEQCWVNADYIVDIFPLKDKPQYVAYTLDDERGGYLITAYDFKRIQIDAQQTTEVVVVKEEQA